MKSFHEEVREQEYLERIGEARRRRKQEREDQRIADKRKREIWGEDYPGQYGGNQ